MCGGSSDRSFVLYPLSNVFQNYCFKGCYELSYPQDETDFYAGSRGDAGFLSFTEWSFTTRKDGNVYLMMHLTDFVYVYMVSNI